MNWVIMRMVVDFPAPFGPRKPCTSPDLTARSRPSSAVVRPNVLRSARTSIAFVMNPVYITFTVF